MDEPLTLVIKSIFGDNKKRFTIPENSTFHELQNTVSSTEFK